MSNNNGNGTVKWIAIIVGILTLFFSTAYGVMNSRLNRHDEIIMQIHGDLREIKADLKYLREREK